MQDRPVRVRRASAAKRDASATDPAVKQTLVKKGHKNARVSAAAVIVSAVGKGKAGAPKAHQERRSTPDSITETLLEFQEGKEGDAGWTQGELSELLAKKQAIANKKTSDAYATHTRKWQHYISHNEDGKKRTKPREKDLLKDAGRAVAGRFLLWLQKGAPGWTANAGRPRKEQLTLSSLEGAHSALSSIYNNQKVANTCVGQGSNNQLPSRLIQDAGYNAAYRLVKSTIQKSGDRSTVVDPQRNTIEDAPSLDDLLLIVGAMFSKGTPAGDRALAMSTWAHSSVGRSDDVRLFYLADLIAPQLIPAVGPTNCYVLPVVLKGGKAMKGGKVGYSGTVRNLFTEICPQRGIAYHLAHHFSLAGCPFPDPRNTEEWLSAPMWPGKAGGTTNISYESQASDLKQLLKEVDLAYSKLTHMFRVGGARHLDVQGVDDQVIMRMGKWLHQAMYTHYLSFFKTEGLLAMGCWPHAVAKDFGHFWHERFELNVPQELINHVYPFLSEFKQRLEQVDELLPSMKSLVEVLEYLAVVLVQDAVELLSQDKYREHPVHQHLMEDELFMEVLEDYKSLKSAGAFEVRRPRTTKEVAVHNNQLLQELPQRLLAVCQQHAGSANPLAGWSEALLQQPQAPRPTPEEQEQLAQQELSKLMQQVDGLNKSGAVPTNDVHLFEDGKSNTAGAGMSTPPRHRQQRSAAARVADAACGATAGSSRQRLATGVGPAAAADSRKRGAEQPPSQRRRLRTTGQQAAAQAGAKLQDEDEEMEDEELEDEEMEDEEEGVVGGNGGSNAAAQPPHNLFPNLQHGAAAAGQRGSSKGRVDAYSSRVCGTSQQVPNPATWVNANHNVAHSRITVNLPGHNVPVPLESLVQAGLIPAPNQQPASNMGPAAAATAATAHLAEPSMAAAAAAASQPAASFFRQGPVGEASKKAAMSRGLSAAAAGTGAVPGVGTAGSGAAVTGAAAYGAARGKPGKRSKLVNAAEVAATAAEAAVAAVAAAQGTGSKGKQAAVLPPLGSISSFKKLWSCYAQGHNGGVAWQTQEAGGPGWRSGERQLWGKIKLGVEEVKRHARVLDISYEDAAAKLDEKRGTTSLSNYIRDVLPKDVKARKEQAAAGAVPGQQAAVHAATAAAAAAQAAATAAAAAATAAANAVGGL